MIQLLHTFRLWAAALLLAALCSSCATRTRVVYLQDIQPGVPLSLQEGGTITFQPGDHLNVTVYSRNHDVANVFNLRSGEDVNDQHPYAVDEQGNIDMPVLGMVNVQGKTREELASLIKYKLLTAQLVQDPIVLVDYADMTFSVLGEVNGAGAVIIDRDRINLLEAIALAGDLTINGRRDNVLVLRTVDGRQTPYRVDLTQVNSVYSSPVFYLRQNDIVYVEPNIQRANQSDVNANTIRTPGFWFSITSFIMTLYLFIKK